MCLEQSNELSIVFRPGIIHAGGVVCVLGNESRNLLVKAYTEGMRPRDVARAFGVSESSVYRLASQMRETGSVDLRTSSRGRKRSLSEADLARLDAYVEARPDATVAEANRDLALGVCDETVRKALVALGWVRKRKSVHASERERLRRGREEG